MFKVLRKKGSRKMKKGFTLIELLAVIIILAVIALISTPIVLDVVDKSKEKSFESSAYGVLDAIRFKTMEDRINEVPLTKEYEFPTTEISVQGSQPNGSAKVDSQGKIKIAVHNNERCAIKDYNDNELEFKDYVEGECELPEDEVVLVGTPIIDKVKELVYDADGKCKNDGSTYQYMGGCYIKLNSNKTLTNHIWYNGFLWRIMGINSDGNIRMITEENVTSIPYDNNSSNFDGSHADKWLNEYFYDELNNENNLRNNVIVSGTFCQGAATTINTSNRTDCTNGTELIRNVGLLSLDEYNLAGGLYSYIKNSQHFWTLSKSDTSNVWRVNSVAYVHKFSVNETYGLRPVINVDDETIITSGSGTLSDFYVLGENKGNTNITGTLATAKVGEYVSLNNKIYRVVKNGETTKMILDGYYQETAGTNYTMKFGNDSVFTSENRDTEDETLSGIGYKLNTSVLNWLTAGVNQEKLKSMILPSTWYQNNFSPGKSYEISLNETNPTRSIENVQVGLIRVGEMLSAQSYSILTKNGLQVSDDDNASNYWTLTPYNSIQVWLVFDGGYASKGYSVDYPFSLRPVINISSTNAVISGNGAPNTPYVIGID